MDRRKFVQGLAATLGVPVPVDGQQTERLYRLGFLTNLPATTPEVARNHDALFQGLREHGYVEGRNLSVEWRFSEGRPERWPELARELVEAKVDILVTNTTPAALALKKATKTIPIVIPSAFDPVGAGLADSLARPGGNVTGLALLIPEVSGKGLALLKEAIPKLSRVAVLWNPGNPVSAPMWKEAEGASRALDLRLHSEKVLTPKDFDGAFAAIVQQRPDGLLALADALLFQHRKQIVHFATQNRLPGVFHFREFAEAGGLMSYGPNLAEMWRRGGHYVATILRGARPADLPIEQPTKFELVINVKTAKALGLTIPPSLLLRADQVIE